MTQLSLGPPRPVAIAAGEIGSRLPEFAMKELQGRELSGSQGKRQNQVGLNRRVFMV
jgi:hypothetical protein